MKTLEDGVLREGFGHQKHVLEGGIKTLAISATEPKEWVTQRPRTEPNMRGGGKNVNVVMSNDILLYL